jgi:hypothetical protein
MSTKPLRIGITLDGSVSAGAYIAGVLDYLLEVLDAWSAAKKKGDKSIPTHDISIEVITGASGGGISGAMTALSIFQQRYPVTADKRNDPDYLKKNIFYNGWVNIERPDMIPPMLETDDIVENSKVVSMLNSTFVESLAERILTYSAASAAPLPDYANPGMKLVLSLSNLEGFKYAMKFEGAGSTDYLMTQHRDYAFFRLGKEYDGVGSIPLSFPGGIGIAELVQSASATAAFPIGLAYRLFEREMKYILDNPLLIDPGLPLVDPSSLSSPESIYAAYYVDGGLLNNEPFDMAAKLLEMGEPLESARQDATSSSSQDAFDRTILMIEPFPSSDFISDEKIKKGGRVYGQVVPEKGTPKFPFTVWQVVSQIYSTMRTQLRFKETQLAQAMDENDYSRFIISPRRQAKDGKIYNGSIAIACGALDGFSGFLDIEFRRHDFFLGRQNCQGFIQKFFCVPENTTNPIFADGYRNEEAKQRFRFQDPTDKKYYLPIIPDVKDVYDDEPDYPYPSYDMDQFDKYREALLNRLAKIIDVSVTKAGERFWMKLTFCFTKGLVFRKIKGVVQDQLQQWGLLR